MFGRSKPQVYATFVSCLALFRSGGWAQGYMWQNGKGCGWGAIDHFAPDNRTRRIAARQLRKVIRNGNRLWWNVSIAATALVVYSVLFLPFLLGSFFYSPLEIFGFAFALTMTACLFLVALTKGVIVHWNDDRSSLPDVLSAFETLVEKNRPSTPNLDTIVAIDLIGEFPPDAHHQPAGPQGSQEAQEGQQDPSPARQPHGSRRGTPIHGARAQEA